MGEGGGEVLGDQDVGLLQRGDAEAVLHQSHSQDFGMREGRMSVGRRAPVGQSWVGFQGVVDEVVELCHLVYNRSTQFAAPNLPFLRCGFEPTESRSMHRKG